MNKQSIALILAGLAIAIGLAAIVQVQQLKRTAPGRAEGRPDIIAAAAPAHPTSSQLKRMEAAFPSPGMFMTLIQLDMAKLYFAATARNWDLAQFELAEIQENLDCVGTLRPEENGLSLTAIITAFKATELSAVQDAITMKDAHLFRDAYAGAIRGCNTCHQATQRPYLIITSPTNPPVSNQQWALPVPLTP